MVRLLQVSLSRFFKLSVLMLVILSFGGCHRYYNNDPLLNPPKGFKLPKRVKGTSDSRLMKRMRNFNSQGNIKVMSIGSDYLISIPSSMLFPSQSPRITWTGYAALNRVAKLLKEFRKVAVNVTAYSSQYVSIQREQALTLTRARNVGDYLWSQGIDSRFIFVEGAGSEKPITHYRTGKDNAPSSRVEITFRDAII